MVSQQQFSRQDVAKHSTEDDLWVIVDHRVFDLSDFADAHPGGSVVLAQVAGQDATEAFYNLHRHEVIQQYSKLCIGTVQGEKPEVKDPQPGDISDVPYAEPLWLTPQFKSPYYNASHRRMQQEMRKFVDTYLTPEAQQKEKDGTYISQELVDRMSKNGLLAMRMGPGKHLHDKKLFEGAIDGKEFDYFHDLISCQETARTGARGFQDGNLAGMAISLSAIQEWCHDKEVRDRIVSEVLAGKAYSCLAVTEAFAGSDVAGLRTTAEISEDGQHYIINGTKKWITNGMFCTYFVTLCKTDKGYSAIIVERDDNVETKAIKTSYSPSAATSFVEFNNVKVPRRNLLGEEHKGFAVAMSNFNHERWMMAAMVTAWSRNVTQESLKWAHQRLVFGKPLINQPVIRQKLGKMISQVEAMQAWLESITYQMNNLSYSQQAKHLSGPIAMLKAFCTSNAREISTEGVHIFGGRGLTQSGMGRLAEMFSRTVEFDAILGGTEEILTDLGVRQAMKFMPKSARL